MVKLNELEPNKEYVILYDDQLTRCKFLEITGKLWWKRARFIGKSSYYDGGKLLYTIDHIKEVPAYNIWAPKEKKTK